MSLLEDTKRMVEQATGLRRPKKRDLPDLLNPPRVNAFKFSDDGETPNNPNFPLLIYRAAIRLDPAFDRAAIFEELFASNGWKDAWRDGIYEFLHFHSSTHEVLGIARGHASVEFGGNHGGTFTVRAGDVIVIPAGTGHCRNSASRDFLVVGAYPQAGEYDEPKPGEIDHAEAAAEIARAKAPAKDPVFGRDGPMRQLWRL